MIRLDGQRLRSESRNTIIFCNFDSLVKPMTFEDSGRTHLLSRSANDIFYTKKESFFSFLFLI